MVLDACFILPFIDCIAKDPGNPFQAVDFRLVYYFGERPNQTSRTILAILFFNIEIRNTLKDAAAPATHICLNSLRNLAVG